MNRAMNLGLLMTVLVGGAAVLSSGCVAASDEGEDISLGNDAVKDSDLKPTGKGIGTLEKFQNPNNGGKPTSGNGIVYHGGAVMLGTVNVYLIWYGNWSGNSATTILPDFVKSVGGSSYEHINTTYYDGSNNHVSGAIALAGQVNDSYSQGSSLTDNSIQSIVSAHVGKDLPSDANGIYFVLTSKDVKETSGFCTQFCGWHTHATIGGKDIKYSFVGDPSSQCPASCEEQTVSPNGNDGADAMASIIAHESEEAISDPDLNAWYDRRGYENADKCAWTFGTEYNAANGSKANVHLGTRDYLIQQNWVNAGGGYCSMSY